MTDTMPPPLNERRYGLLRVTPETFVRMCADMTSRWGCVRNWLPEDARIAGVGTQRWTFEADIGCITIIVESASFAVVPEGEKIPLLPSPVFAELPYGSDG